MKQIFYLIILLLSVHSFSQTEGTEAAMAIEQTTEDNNVYNAEEVDKRPQFDAGLEQFMKLFKKQFKLPRPARNKDRYNIPIEFIVEKDGSLSNIVIVKDPGYGLAEEIKRVLVKLPKWSPGIKEGEPVRCKMKFVLPIVIKERRIESTHMKQFRTP